MLVADISQMTVSAGGNDVGLVDILNDCIFGWKIAGYSSSSCDKTLANTHSLIDNQLPTALDNLLTAAKAKLNPTTGRIYYTAYAQFFGSSSQCDSVYWNFFPLDPFAQALTTERRNSMNTLATNVNKAIAAAVARAGPQVVYVDYVSLLSSRLNCLDLQSTKGASEVENLGKISWALVSSG